MCSSDLTKMMLAVLGTFYATMVVAAYIVEFSFGALGLIPATRDARVGDTGVQWNYTTYLNIVFLLLAAALLVRFFRSGGGPMLKMMGGGPAEPSEHGQPGQHGRHGQAGQLGQHGHGEPRRHGHGGPALPTGGR